MVHNPNSTGSIKAATLAPLAQPLHSHDDGPAAGLVALECAGLTKRFGSVDAINGLDLAVHPGQVLALLGPSGCGNRCAETRGIFCEQPAPPQSSLPTTRKRPSLWEMSWRS